ncbi:MAG: hypothetical protein J7M38_13135 [Armatimonadetes bacterium]|nr:hypothetical protein [Armatimonadota bacterium]
MRTVTCLLVVIMVCPLLAQEAEYSFTPLDDFEDTSPWIKGDPNTDLTQKDAAVVPSTKFVHEGKQSIAFMISVNWTPREGEKYAKGWPMLTRSFDPPQDWSQYDAVAFWLYTDTEITLPHDRVLRCKPLVPYEDGQDWYTIPDIEPGRWQQIFMPLQARYDWSQVTGFSFYVAEQWYHDGDRIDFYIDDMRLARRNWPVLESATVTSRIFPRGHAPRVAVDLAGPVEGATLRCTIRDQGGAVRYGEKVPLSQRHTVFDLNANNLAAGGYYADLQLSDAGGTLRGSVRRYFRIMQPGRRTYLSLITFYTPRLVDLDEEKQARLSVLNDSAYAGVAVPLVGSYYTAPVPDLEDLVPKMNMADEALDIDIWPWVSLNRMIGAPEDARGHASTHAEAPEYFRRIPILDLDNETGARSDFLKLWRLAARAAKRWNSPGLVVDYEAYNNYRAYGVQYVADRRGETVDQVITKCEALGADMARIIEQEYPECVIWTLFSRLDRPVTIPGHAGMVHPTPGHISKGFLDYAREHEVPCRYLCGGEVSVGYYSANPEALRAKIAARDMNMAWALERWPDHLFLAGTISPYHDHTILTSWIRKKAGDDPELKTIEDFEPMFETLFDAYDWVWIYASSAGRTLPYDPDNNARYSAVYRAALAASAGE